MSSACDNPFTCGHRIPGLWVNDWLACVLPRGVEDEVGMGMEWGWGGDEVEVEMLQIKI